MRTLVVEDFSVSRCTFEQSSAIPVLRVLDAVYVEDLEASDTWCQVHDLAAYYGSVELRSIHRDRIDLRELYASRYDLVLAKPELFIGVGQAAKKGIAYEKIAQYPDYGSQLVSLRGTPQLTRQWMKGKTLGLLDDPNSVSAYQVPMAALNEKGMADEIDIIYFRSYLQMFKALFAKEVDVIASLLSDEGPSSAIQLPPGLVLDSSLPGPGWYIRKELLHTQTHCQLLTAITTLAAQERIDFLRDVSSTVPCHVQ